MKPGLIRLRSSCERPSVSFSFYVLVSSSHIVPSGSARIGETNVIASRTSLPQVKGSCLS